MVCNLVTAGETGVAKTYKNTAKQAVTEEREGTLKQKEEK